MALVDMRSYPLYLESTTLTQDHSSCNRTRTNDPYHMTKKMQPYPLLIKPTTPQREESSHFSIARVTAAHFSHPCFI
jgi:hypothetical protein